MRVARNVVALVTLVLAVVSFGAVAAPVATAAVAQQTAGSAAAAAGAATVMSPGAASNRQACIGTDSCGGGLVLVGGAPTVGALGAGTGTIPVPDRSSRPLPADPEDPLPSGAAVVLLHPPQVP